MTGQQIYYASHLKPAALNDSKTIDDEDRAALLGAIGRAGIPMPRLKPVLMGSGTINTACPRVLVCRVDEVVR
jgi:hypothetical protein